MKKWKKKNEVNLKFNLGLDFQLRNKWELRLLILNSVLLHESVLQIAILGFLIIQIFSNQKALPRSLFIKCINY